MIPKLYLGPVSRNTVDAVIKISNEKKIPLGLIPSRRQVDFNGGYIGWNTKDFAHYVKSQSNLILLSRDHGGPYQGDKKDFGIKSMIEDAQYFDIIHIDPFKLANSLEEAANQTLIYLEALYYQNPNLFFEIGTEEGIKKYGVDEFKTFIEKIFIDLDLSILEKILYLVVQGGTYVKAADNQGLADFERLSKFVNLCQDVGKLSKEHNGDYLEFNDIQQKFKIGLSAINIAPEFGSIESEYLWSKFSKSDQQVFVNLVINSGKWIKWFDKSFNPHQNYEKVIKMAGHYVYQNPKFLEIKKSYNLDIEVISLIENKILNVIEAYENCSI